MTKPVVHYVGEAFIKVGQSAYLDQTLDHPHLSNRANLFGVQTSRVISHDEATGDFETLNTKYVKVQEPLE
jgi:hypothetical protein